MNVTCEATIARWKNTLPGLPVPDDKAIAKAVVSLGHELHLRVLAEGVETAEQLAFLRASGCDEMQGYYFSRPIAAPAVALLLLAQGTAPSLIRLQRAPESLVPSTDLPVVKPEANSANGRAGVLPGGIANGLFATGILLVAIE